MAALILASCTGTDSPTGSGPPPQAVGTVAFLTSPGDQVVGGVVTLDVRVDDTNGRPMANQGVAFSATAGAVTPASANTGASGTATVVWTVGTTAGSQTLTATAAGRSAALVITARAATAARFHKLSGDAQSGAAGEPLQHPVVVVVTDQHGNPRDGEAITAAVAAGGGSIAVVPTTTGPEGQGSVVWILGPTLAENRLTVTHALGTLTFTATARPGAPAKVTLVSGTGQSASAGTALPAPLAVEVRDRLDHRVPGARVAFVPGPASGAPTTDTVITDSLGQARVGWTLGTTAGPQTMEARVVGLAPALFSATAAAGPPARIEVVTGGNQSGAVGQVLPLPVRVKVSDAFGNGVPATAVTFTPAPPGGEALPAQATTDAEGRASSSWRLGTRAGAQSLAATVPGIESAVTSALAAPGPPSEVRAASGSAQSATVGRELAAPLVAEVVDAFGNPVRGTVVIFAPAPASGSVAPASGASGDDGRISTSWTLGTTSGVQRVIASAAGLQTGATFTATATPGPATTFAVVSGDAQRGAATLPLASPLAVAARDSFGNGVPGVTVTFTVTGGGGSVSPAVTPTSAAGTASAIFTLGPGVGTHTVRASAGALGTVAFSATATSGAPAILLKVSGDGQLRGAGDTVTVTVQLSDAVGNRVPNASVAFAPAPGSGSAPSPVATDAQGRASTIWTLGTRAGVNTLSATVAGLPPVTFTATGQAPPSSFNIHVRVIGTMPAGMTAAFDAARARWERVIVGDLPDVSLSAAQVGACGISPGEAILADDLVIYAQVRPMDGPGKVLGQAGPCWIRAGSMLPILGIMEFDEDDLAVLQAQGTLGDVILHEMGHVLGIGTVWVDQSLLQGAGGEDPYFSGAGAVSAYQGLGASVVNGVPVENSGGWGTRDSHWREGVFGNELMTGFLDPAPNPLSIVTVRSLADQGYHVNLAAAGAYALPSPAPLRIAPPEDKVPWEVLIRPIGTVAPDGTVTLIPPQR